MKRVFGLVAALCLLGANGALAGGTVRVMTRNLYVGTDVDAVLEASRSELPFAVAQAYVTFLSTQFEARMAAIAAEIDETRPDLVGLQEVTKLYIQSPGDSLNPPPGSTSVDETDETLVADFLATLLDKLEKDQQLVYKPVIKTRNVDIELPMATEDGYADLRLIDYDVILARDGVQIKEAVGGNYSPAVHVQTATITRGWVYVDADINGDDKSEVRFASTHIEDIDTVRYAQTVELIRALARTSLPLILVGDFNSKTSDDLAHRALVAAGYTDQWGGTDPDGYTCCYDAELTNQDPVMQLYERDDIIFTRDAEATVASTLIGNAGGQLPGTGTDADHPALYWPSDHMGVWAELDIPSQGQ